MLFLVLREIRQRHRIPDKVRYVILQQPVPHVLREQKGLAAPRHAKISCHALAPCGGPQRVSSLPQDPGQKPLRYREIPKAH